MTDKKANIISKIKDHPISAGIVLLSSVLAGVVSMLGNIESVTEYFKPDPKATLIQFGIIPGNIYQEQESYTTLKSMEPLSSIDNDPFDFNREMELPPEPIEEPQYITGYTPRRVSSANKNALKGRYPVFQATFSNPTKNDLIISSIRYHVSYSVPAAGREPGPLIANHRYSYSLSDGIGTQTQKLVQPFVIPPESNGSFELALYSAGTSVTAKQLKIEFVADQRTFSTEVFEILLFGTSGNSNVR